MAFTNITSGGNIFIIPKQLVDCLVIFTWCLQPNNWFFQYHLLLLSMGKVCQRSKRPQTHVLSS